MVTVSSRLPYVVDTQPLRDTTIIKKDEVTVSVYKAHEKARIRIETPSVQELSKEHRSTNFIKSCS